MSLVGLLASGRVKIVNGQLQLVPIKPQLRNKFGVRLQNQDALLDSDSDYPSSSSHSSPIPLLRSRPARHDHDDIDVDLTLHNEDIDSDDAPCFSEVFQVVFSGFRCEGESGSQK